jgi:hypothetical protein
MKDNTLEEHFEAVLYAAGVNNSGELAGALVDAYKEWVTDVWPRLAMRSLDEDLPRRTYEAGDNQ